MNGVVDEDIQQEVVTDVASSILDNEFEVVGAGRQRIERPLQEVQVRQPILKVVNRFIHYGVINQLFGSVFRTDIEAELVVLRDEVAAVRCI